MEFTLANKFSATFEQIGANNQYQHLAKALVAGSAQLDIPVAPELAALPNPYDTGLRRAQKVPYYWDLVFYQGHYYVYFGLIPCLLFYLPYYLLTGAPAQNYLVMMIAGCAVIGGVFYLLHLLIKHYFPRSSLASYHLLAIGFSAGSLLFHLARRSAIYETVDCCGLMFCIWGLALWLAARRRQQQRIVANSSLQHPRSYRWQLLGGSVCMACVAGTRPPMFIGVILLGLSLFGPWLLAKGSRSDQLRCYLRQQLTDLILLSVPFLLIAFLLSYYNYLRFGDLLETGNAYMLTADDYSHKVYSLAKLVLGYFQLLFQPPTLSLEYPFIHSIPVQSLYQGYCYRGPMFGGTLASTPILWVLCCSGQVKTILQQKKLADLLLACVIATAVIAGVAVLFAGLIHRYQADYAWLLLLAATLVLLALLEQHAMSASAGRLLRHLFCWSTLLTVVFHLLLFFTKGDGGVYDRNIQQYLRIAHYLYFWR